MNNTFFGAIELYLIPDYSPLNKVTGGKNKHSNIKRIFKISGKQTASIKPTARNRYPKSRINNKIY